MTDKFTNPFKGLKPYRREDYGKLFGRDKDLFLMKDRIYRSKTTLLFAGSGVGKTSFLNAKVIPELDPRYFVFYHNEWAVADPLVALKERLAKELAVERPDLEDGGLKDYFETAGHSLKDFCECYRESRCIFILDQFEELFRYHAYESYFQKFLREICEIINDEQLQIRIIFAMRQEFLGDLSIFDNLIPDLFNNYYHLTYPDKIQAEEIITRTAALGVDSGDTRTVKVDEGALELLMNDLSKIEKVKTAKESIVTKGRELQRDFIEPPYLQIVCQRLWNEQVNPKSQEAKDIAKSSWFSKIRLVFSCIYWFLLRKPYLFNYTFHFLEKYQTGSAKKILEGFCHEKIDVLSAREKDATASVFDFLVTAHGSKMAYDLDSLARYMKNDKTRLLRTLEKLSVEDVQILRITRRPDNSTWVELYHDMFSAIVFTWKETYQRKRRRRLIVRNISIAAITTAVVAINVFYTYPYFKIKWTVIDPLQNKLDAFKAGKTTDLEFKQILARAKIDAPGSPRVDDIENQYKAWNYTKDHSGVPPDSEKPPKSTTKFRSIPIPNDKDKEYLSEDTVRSMLMEKGFFDSYRNKSAQGFYNDFESQSDGKIVYDRASGLGWQQSGSDNYMTFDEAAEYIDRLNRDKFAGYSDWRLPTLEEAMSLMEPTRNEDGLYIAPVFGNKQKWIWTSDRLSASSAWVVDFGYGSCYYVDFYYGLYVRAVR